MSPALSVCCASGSSAIPCAHSRVPLQVDFLWFLKKASLAALVGYGAGIGAYLAQTAALQAFAS